jgi:LysM repeat protein
MQFQQQAEIDRLKSEVRRLQGQVDGILETQDRLFTEVNSVRTAQDGMRAELQGGIQEIRSTVESESTARESMRGEIISHIGDRVTKILDRQASQTPPVRSERGYEHVVKPGQTLSEIASVYGAKVDEIVAANKLSSPDKIRVGQKLFIPARAGAR